MTASIVVMNSAGVALATDSAVTIPGRRLTKHYKGACKLVACHSSAPVAMLWYSSPDYLGVPWEVIIKDYRTTISGTRQRLRDYALDFLSYLDTSLPGWALGEQVEPLGAALVAPLVERVRAALVRDGEHAQTAVSEAVEAWKRSLRPRRRVLSEERVNACVSLRGWVESELDALEDIAGKFSDGTRQELRDAARSAWSHLSAHEPLHTGLVFAGFGEHDRLPAMASFLVGVPAEGNPRWLEGLNAGVSSKTPAVIVPFAQNDQVRLFMEGLHPSLRKMIAGMIGQLNQSVGLEPVLKRMERQLDQYIDDHGKPVVDAVRFLPKADLAEFARSMIAFTALRMRMSMSSETVGEPIDVAVISRSEGVVWIHRNHYFPAELNPHFLGRYRL